MSAAPAALEPDRFSYTALSLADTCPLAYAARYGNGDRFKRIGVSVASDALERGRVLHTAIQLYIEYLDDKKLTDDRWMMPTFVERAFVEDPESLSTATWEDAWIAARTFASWYVHDPAHSLSTEFRLERELDIPGERPALIVGYPDLAQRARDDDGEFAQFTDWKTGWDSTVSDLNHFQGKIVCWLALNPQGSLAGLGRAAYRVAWPRQKQYSPTFALDERDAFSLEARMRAIVRRIRLARAKNEFPARPGRQCTWCSLAASCATNLALGELRAQIVTPEDAREALVQIGLLDAGGASLTKALKVYVDANGPVRSNGLIAQYAYKEKLALRGVIPLLQRAGWIPRRLPKELPEAVAFFSGLLSINGTKTKTKTVQRDSRLRGLWELKAGTSWSLGAEKASSDDDDEVPAPPGAGTESDAD